MPHLGPPVPYSGPRSASILIIGEAPGDKESEEGRPFCGPSGWLLRTTLASVGVTLRDCRVTNVFSRQPPNNDLLFYGVPPSDSRALLGFGPMQKNPKLSYLSIDHAPELERLWEEIEDCSPNIILALGNTASWALGLGIGISDLRGSIYPSAFPAQSRQWKALPSLHPAAVLRQWKDRPYIIADFQKAANESHSPRISYDECELLVPETLGEVRELLSLLLLDPAPIACDIETLRGQITCIGFATGPSLAICVPFWDKDNPERPNYWSTPEEELTAWAMVRDLLEGPAPKLFQNGLYDLQYIRGVGISPANCLHDTMLAHHALWPELRKSLGVLGSIYANVPGWKKMRTFQREERFKRDE